MGVAMKYFLVDGEEVLKVSKKDREEFYDQGLNVFPDYSGQILDFACVMVELENRKPVRVLRIDRVRNKVNQRGGIDLDYEDEMGRHILNKIEPPKVASSNQLIDASNVFESKRLDGKYVWQMSPKVERKILKALALVS